MEMLVGVLDFTWLKSGELLRSFEKSHEENCPGFKQLSIF
jgi:hypothetical protein